jgi:hypothetical protein
MRGRLAKLWKSLRRPREPRLLIISDHRIKLETVERIRDQIKEWRSNPSQALVVEYPLSLYQLVDGRWQPIQPSPRLDLDIISA